MTATRSTPRSARRPALFAGDTHSITSNKTGSRQARPRPSTAHESRGGARSHPGTRHPDARAGAGARRRRVAQAADLGKRSRSVDRCSRRQRVMRTARHGGFADESARGSSCRGASAQHAETSALTQPIAKAPPRRILLAGLLWRAVNLACAAEVLVAIALSARYRARTVLACVFREITAQVWLLPRELAG